MRGTSRRASNSGHGFCTRRDRPTRAGPNTGVFLQITCDDAFDLPVPGQKYTFGVVKAAQARGDFEVLVEREPPCAPRASRCGRRRSPGDLAGCIGFGAAVACDKQPGFSRESPAARGELAAGTAPQGRRRRSENRKKRWPTSCRQRRTWAGCRRTRNSPGFSGPRCCTTFTRPTRTTGWSVTRPTPTRHAASRPSVSPWRRSQRLSSAACSFASSLRRAPAADCAAS